MVIWLSYFTYVFIFDFQMPEEEAFAVLVKLMQDYRLRELFKPSMAELGLCMYKLECLIQVIIREKYCRNHLEIYGGGGAIEDLYIAFIIIRVA